MRDENLRAEYKRAAITGAFLSFDASDRGIALLKSRIEDTNTGVLTETQQVARPLPKTFKHAAKRILGMDVSLEEQFLLGPDDIEKDLGFGLLRESLKKVHGIHMSVDRTTSVYIDHGGITYSPASISFRFSRVEGPTEKQKAYFDANPLVKRAYERLKP